MKTPSLISNSLFSISGEELDQLHSLIFDKDYSTDVLDFISTKNVSRVINYWESKGLLPFGSEKEKHKKFSFVEIIWLHIVKELRDFGIDARIIGLIKAELLDTGIFSKMEREFKDNPELREVASKFSNISYEEFKEALNEISKKNYQIEALKICALTSFIVMCLGHREQINLIITTDGKCLPFFIKKYEEYFHNEKLYELITRNHISISLNAIINYHLPKDHVKNPLRNVVFSPQELAIIDATRKKGIKSVEIKLNNGKVETIEQKFIKNIHLDQRLSDIIMENGYQEITIKTQKGQIVSCINNIKTKK